VRAINGGDLFPVLKKLVSGYRNYCTVPGWELGVHYKKGPISLRSVSTQLHKVTFSNLYVWLVLQQRSSHPSLCVCPKESCFQQKLRELVFWWGNSSLKDTRFLKVCVVSMPTSPNLPQMDGKLQKYYLLCQHVCVSDSVVFKLCLLFPKSINFILIIHIIKIYLCQYDG
jgi:hypothetical protein